MARTMYVNAVFIWFTVLHGIQCIQDYVLNIFTYIRIQTSHIRSVLANLRINEVLNLHVANQCVSCYVRGVNFTCCKLPCALPAYTRYMCACKYNKDNLLDENGLLSFITYFFAYTSKGQVNIILTNHVCIILSFYPNRNLQILSQRNNTSLLCTKAVHPLRFHRHIRKNKMLFMLR